MNGICIPIREGHRAVKRTYVMAKSNQPNRVQSETLEVAKKKPPMPTQLVNVLIVVANHINATYHK